MSDPLMSYDPATGIYSITALVGEGCTRRRGTIYVTLRDIGDDYGVLCSAGSGDPYRLVGETVLAGWGDMDGLAYDVQPEGSAQVATVPREPWQAILTY